MNAHGSKEGRPWNRSTSLVGLLIVISSFVVSIVSYQVLEESIRIRWTIGTYYHYGPERASTLLVLSTFPVVLTAIYVGSWWLEHYLNDVEEIRVVYDIVVITVLGGLGVLQLGLVVLNLW